MPNEVLGHWLMSTFRETSKLRPVNRIPKQVDGLDVETQESGLIVNDHNSDRVHYLNQTAALVFTLCNGRNSIHTIATLLRKQFELPSTPLDDVGEIIDEFVEEELVKFIDVHTDQ